MISFDGSSSCGGFIDDLWIKILGLIYMVLMELHMPDMYGLDLLDEIKRISDLPALSGLFVL